MFASSGAPPRTGAYVRHGIQLREPGGATKSAGAARLTRTAYDRGKPKPRVAITFRFTSLVPAAIVLATLLR